LINAAPTMSRKIEPRWPPVFGAPDATAVQSFLRNPRVKLMSFPMADALSRLYPDLVRLVLPQGVVDLDNIIPPNDVPIIGSTTRVLVKSNLHPQIIELLLKTMVEEHGGPGIFQRAGNSPTPTMSNIPLPRALSIITRTALRSYRGICLCG